MCDFRDHPSITPVVFFSRLQSLTESMFQLQNVTSVLVNLKACQPVGQTWRIEVSPEAREYAHFDT